MTLWWRWRTTVSLSWPCQISEPSPTLTDNHRHLCPAPLLRIPAERESLHSRLQDQNTHWILLSLWSSIIGLMKSVAVVGSVYRKHSSNLWINLETCNASLVDVFIFVLASVSGWAEYTHLATTLDVYNSSLTMQLVILTPRTCLCRMFYKSPLHLLMGFRMAN